MRAARPRRRRLHWLDLAIFAALGLFAGYTAYRVGAVLEYRWNWSVIPRYFLRWDPDSASWVANLLLQGLGITLRLTIWGSLLAGTIGLMMGLARTSRDPFLRTASRLYVELVRNIPPLVFIFIFYFFISSQLMPLFDIDGLVQGASPTTLVLLDILFGDPARLGDFLPGLLAIALFEAAYMTEIIRAGIQSIEKGQWEASAALGLGRWQTLRKVILPQAFHRIVPALSGQFISLIKDSAIVSLISVPELSFQGAQVASSTRSMFEVWITIALLYFLLCAGCAQIFARLHKSGGRQDARR